MSATLQHCNPYIRKGVFIKYIDVGLAVLQTVGSVAEQVLLTHGLTSKGSSGDSASLIRLSESSGRGLITQINSSLPPDDDYIILRMTIT